jgi:transcriptional regulator with XRE-family HTH domain
MTMSTPRKTMGERIRELREREDLSLRELAKRVGKSAAFLSDVELSRRHPSAEVLALIAKALSATLDDLKSYDVRPAVKEIQRRVSQDPALGFALRRVVEKNISADELDDFIEKRRGKPRR